jgi:hypothetical protein
LKRLYLVIGSRKYLVSCYEGVRHRITQYTLRPVFVAIEELR